MVCAVARVADEAVGLGERRRADELGVGLHRQAGRDAGAALDAGHRLGDVDHRLRRDDVLALGRVALRQQPRSDAADLRPVRRLHVGDQVLDHRHVPHRLDDDRARRLLARASGRRSAAPLRGWRARGPRRSGSCRRASTAPLIFIPHEPQIAARHEQRTDERAVLAVADLKQAVEHREVWSSSTSNSCQYGPSPGLGLVAADLERVLRHLPALPTLVGPLRRLPLGDRHRRVADLGPVAVRGSGRCA